MFFFLTGTDEHGQKIQRAAEQKDIEPKLFCDQISKTFFDLSKTLNLSNNDFIRTTEARHKVSVENLLLNTSPSSALVSASAWSSASTICSSNIMVLAVWPQREQHLRT